ncbi:hypothetical protein WA1_01750 [Scytonema hofmannii PCC 7110]|uniref:Uncharacterized protein n=1 Tax=Scytonema hofmannii PCC 7110 TaxID=128403 RepID=A0A139XGU6_9CYAN|nr:hypothetical protein [Scytonema hofmannii]KYC43901.1 hypothetical protein WA1_01750 [Scytonema hofmannii PCC 7110]
MDAIIITFLLPTGSGSDADIGVIAVGQSCDVTEIPGMTPSNWASTVQLHTGLNARFVTLNI